MIGDDRPLKQTIASAIVGPGERMRPRIAVMFLRKCSMQRGMPDRPNIPRITSDELLIIFIYIIIETQDMTPGFRIQLASDIVRDGLGVELLDSDDRVVAEVFRCDADNTVIVRTF